MREAEKLEILSQDNDKRRAIAVEVLKENAQEDEGRIQEKIEQYGLKDLYKFLQRVAHHGQLYIQSQCRAFYTKQDYWDEPRLATVNDCISEYRDLIEQNQLGTDWHLRILGTRPLFVLDDISTAGLDKLRQDGLPPFAVVETSPGSFHVYIQLNLKDRQMLNEAEWNAMNSYLIQQYGADKGLTRAGTPSGYRSAALINTTRRLSCSFRFSRTPSRLLTPMRCCGKFRLKCWKKLNGN